MSRRRAARASSGKRVPYRAPRKPRELWTAVAVGAVIVIATASLVWFLRPNRDSGSTTTGTVPGITEQTTPTTTVPTDATAPADTTAPTDTAVPTDTTAPAGG